MEPTTIIYNKLVRDKIPEIIEAKGSRAVTEILDQSAYEKALNTKLPMFCFPIMMKSGIRAIGSTKA